MVMPDTDVAFAYQVSERLRQSIETTPVEISRSPGTLNITISIGIAGSDGESDTAAALLHRADQALYRAKRSRAATRSSPTQPEAAFSALFRASQPVIMPSF